MTAWKTKVMKPFVSPNMKNGRNMIATFPIVLYHNTLVGYFDIQGYSTFIKQKGDVEAITLIKQFFTEMRNSCRAKFGGLKIDVSILSDSIILVMDTNHSPLFKESVKWFLATCSNLLGLSICQFPLRGAIGTGGFYKDGEIMVSSGLVDAAHYEKEQEWLGAILTPKAEDVVRQSGICLSSDEFKRFVRFDEIPWKKTERNKEKPTKLFYIKPLMADKNWAKHLPDYFGCECEKDKVNVKIINSHCLYGQQ